MVSDTLIRYRIEDHKRPAPDVDEARKQIVQVCHLLWQKGYVAAKDGNVSVRLDDNRFLCTPSGFSKGLLQAEQILLINQQSEPIEEDATSSRVSRNGALRASSEFLLHLEAYRRRPDIFAVVHAHPPTAVALSIAGIGLAHCLIPDMVLALGQIPTVEYATPSSREGAMAISERIARYDALVLPRHGSVSVGATPLDAYLVLEKIEQVAQMTKTIFALGTPEPLPLDEIAKLVQWRRDQGLVQPEHENDLCSLCGFSHFAGTEGR